ncbi:MAG: general stress protein [Micromonosporaceae bacterium]
MTSSASGSVLQDRVVVATYDTYREAERAVDHLSDEGFPVQGTLIVGGGLRLIEHVLARQTYLRAAGMGAAAGAWFGLLIGLFFAIFTNSTASFLVVLLSGVIWGAVAGAVFGAVAHWLSGGRRDFVSTSQLVAERYEVLVEPEHADKARELLASLR